jgi:hypothetical protein
MRPRGKVWAGQGGCWFCSHDDDVGTAVFDSEFDTMVHLDCLKEVLEKNPRHPEAKHMAYLLTSNERSE